MSFSKECFSFFYVNDILRGLGGFEIKFCSFFHTFCSFFFCFLVKVRESEQEYIRKKYHRCCCRCRRRRCFLVHGTLVLLFFFLCLPTSSSSSFFFIIFTSSYYPLKDFWCIFMLKYFFF